MEKTFIRVRSAKDIITSISFIIIGAALLALPTGAGINIAGLFMIFAGVILAFALKSDYMETETGVRYRKKEHNITIIKSNVCYFFSSCFKACIHRFE